MSDLTEIYEKHGVWACMTNKGNWVSVSETTNGIALTGQFSDPVMTPAQARYLASKLYRLARRVEKRAEGGK